MRERRVRLDGAYNFRDLGGYPAADGRRVSWGGLFRSDDLAHLSKRDLRKIAELGLALCVDFRGRFERNTSPDKLPPGVEVLPCEIEVGNVFDYLEPDDGGANDMAKAMEGMYRVLARDSRSAYRAFFAELAAPGRTPLVFHCAAGKDRTGFAAALVLAALGVDRETIAADYLLSNSCLKGKYGMYMDGTNDPLFTVDRRYLEAAFGVVDAEFGGAEPYIRDELGVDPKLLREMYTE